MIALISGLFLNGLNPWIKPSYLEAKEITAISENNNSDCNSARKKFNQKFRWG
jgi:hypothetical protein